MLVIGKYFNYNYHLYTVIIVSFRTLAMPEIKQQTL